MVSNMFCDLSFDYPILDCTRFYLIKLELPCTRFVTSPNSSIFLARAKSLLIRFGNKVLVDFINSVTQVYLIKSKLHCVSFVALPNSSMFLGRAKSDLIKFENEVLIDFINFVIRFFDNKLIINKSILRKFWGMEAQAGN